MKNLLRSRCTSVNAGVAPVRPFRLMKGSALRTMIAEGIDKKIPCFSRPNYIFMQIHRQYIEADLLQLLFGQA